MRSVEESFIRLYPSLIRGIGFLVPCALIIYFGFLGNTYSTFESPLVHSVLNGIIVVIGMGVAYATLEAYRKTGYYFLWVDAIGLFAFTLLQFFHLATAWSSTTNPHIILFGNAAALAILAHYSLLALIHARNQDIAQNPPRLWHHILLVGCVSIGFFGILFFAPTLLKPLSLAFNGLAAFAFFTVAGIAIFDFRSSTPKWSYIFSSYLVGCSAITGIMSDPWTHIWWVGHMLLPIALIILGSIAISAYTKQGLLESSVVRRHHHSFARDRRCTFFGTVVALLIFFGAIRIFFPLWNAWSEEKLREYGNEILVHFEQRSNNLLSIASEIARSEAIRHFVSQRDTLGILGALAPIQRSHPVSNIAVLDKTGTVIARTHSIAQVGDRRFEVTASGRLLSRGIPAKGIDAGTTSPMVVIGAQTFVDDIGNLNGAIIAGEPLDATYASRLGTSILESKSYVAFYTIAEGVIGDNFENKEASQLVSTYFNSGSGLLAATSSEIFDRPLRIQGQYYRVGRFPLLGVGGVLGGFILFIPDHSDRWIIVFSALTTLLFLIIVISALWIVAKSTHPLEHAHIIVIFGSIALLLFSSLIFTLDAIRQKNVRLVRQPPYAIYNSTLQFHPEAGIMDIELPQRIALELAPGGEAINGIEATISYDPTRIAIQEIITTASLCEENLFLEKDIDPSKGEVRISCAIPHPGFQKQKGVVAELAIKPLQPGPVSLIITSASVFANDGIGTNVLRTSWDGSYVIASDSPSPESIVIYSPSHPNARRWYAGKTATFFWRSHELDSFSASFSMQPEKDVYHHVVGGEFRETATQDGAWYFTVKNDATGDLATHIVNIDSTPPELSILASEEVVTPGSLVRFIIDGRDTLSGLQDAYYVAVDGGAFFPTGPSVYLSFLEKGAHIVTARIFDRADNHTEKSVLISVH